MLWGLKIPMRRSQQMRSLLSVILLITLVSCNSEKGGDSAKSGAGAVFKYNLGQQPTTLNPLSSSDAYASRVQAYIVESLMERDIDTYMWKPMLATDHAISADGLSYEFTIREGVTWHDGKPFTANDVKFTFDAIMDPDNKYKTAHSKPYFENIKSCEILDGGKKVKFIANKKYFGNFDVVAGMEIVPSHLYKDPSEDQKKELNKTIVGTGAYSFKEFNRGKNIILEKNKNWWGFNDPSRKGENTFDQILMRFIQDGTIAIQRIEKGDLDFISLSPEEFEKKTNSKNWGKSVQKVKMENQAPKGYGFIGWNMKNDIFKSVKVRKALYHLINRPMMIEKFDFGYNLPATGPWYQQSIYADPSIEAIDFNAQKSLALLREDGWKDTDGDQILDKVIDGKKTKLSFTILEPNKEFVKYLTVFKEDAKKAGVDVNVKIVEWNTFIKLLDERNFEAVRLAWSGGSVDLDPKQIWHSSSYENSGSNFIGYNNKKVDQLIDQARETIDRDERVKILKQVYKQIAEDVPYAFLFNARYGFYGHTERMKREKDTYKFGVGLNYWTISK